MRRYAEVFDKIISLSNIKKISLDKNISCYLLEITYTDNTVEEFKTTNLKQAKEDYENLKGLLLDEEYPIVTKVGNNCEIHSKSSQDYDDLIANIKKEAYREFADKLINQQYAGEYVRLSDINFVLRKLEKKY